MRCKGWFSAIPKWEGVSGGGWGLGRGAVLAFFVVIAKEMKNGKGFHTLCCRL